MNKVEKLSIKKSLELFVQSSGSQGKASKKIKGVSPATLSQILNENWESISDSMWTLVKNQVEISTHAVKVLVNTNNRTLLEGIFKDSQAHSQTFGIVSPAGSGKTATVKAFTRENENAFSLSCSDYWNKKRFLKQLLQNMGKNSAGTLDELMDSAIYYLNRIEKPLIILDEADKLSDSVLYFFITLYNELEGKCGICLLSTDFMEKKMKRGLRLQKKGYEEIFSRIGRKFIELPGVCFTDVVKICEANGIEDVDTVKKIWNECDEDLRRVDRKIHAINQQKKRS